jgi:hypothetical protein
VWVMGVGFWWNWHSRASFFGAREHLERESVRSGNVCGIEPMRSGKWEQRLWVAVRLWHVEIS